MSLINVLNISVLNSTAPFLAPYQVEITFECIGELQQDLEVNLYYVGNTNDSAWDQELDSLLVGPVPIGVNKFVMETKPPSIDRLNPIDVLDYTAIYLKCQYREREFLRCSYLIKAEYNNEFMQLNPPENINYDHLIRYVSDKPKVTRFPIPWDGVEEMPPPQPDADNLPALDMDALEAKGQSDEDGDDNDNDNDMEDEIMAN